MLTGLGQVRPDPGPLSTNQVGGPDEGHADGSRQLGQAAALPRDDGEEQPGAHQQDAPGGWSGVRVHWQHGRERTSRDE